MKINKSAYFSMFFLFCFLASFSTNIYKNINFAPTKSNIKNQGSLVFSSKDQGIVGINDFLFEKNENESENYFQVQVFLLPAFITYFQYEVLKPSISFATPLAEKLLTPIYIAVCNIRI